MTNRAKNLKCAECGASPLPAGRLKYCSDRCRNLHADKAKARRAPCRACGGDKGYGTRGGRLCEPCRVLYAMTLQEKERARWRVRSEKKKLASSKPPRNNAAGDRWCLGCLEYLPLDKFKGSSGRCRPCTSEHLHGLLMVRKYGITKDDYYRVYDLQGGRCAICLCKPRKVRLAVDHDHETGEVRGLLCKRCNHDLLGSAHDSTAILTRAVSYLRNPPFVSGKPIPEMEETARQDADEEDFQRARRDEGDSAITVGAELVRITPAAFLALTQLAGWACVIDDTVYSPPAELSIDDWGLSSRVAETSLRLLREAGYQ